jgi:hypothetical protein
MSSPPVINGVSAVYSNRVLSSPLDFGQWKSL